MIEILLQVAVGAALVRSAWLLVGLVRMVPVHLRARTRHWGVAEALALAEVPIFVALSAALLLGFAPVPTAGAASIVAASAGAAFAVSGVFVSLWAIATTLRQRVILDVGHFVKKEHPLVTTGAYGFVRNPMYLGILLLWLGLGLAFQSALLLLVAAAYVLPVLWFYIRAEERMMSSEFGTRFEEYQRRVGRLIPRLHRPHGRR